MVGSKAEILREQSAPLVFSVLSRAGRKDVALIRRLLREAYPFDKSDSWAYRVWLSEVHKQLGFTLKRKKSHPMQMELFEDCQK